MKLLLICSTLLSTGCVDWKLMSLGEHGGVFTGEVFHDKKQCDWAANEAMRNSPKVHFCLQEDIK